MSKATKGCELKDWEATAVLEALDLAIQQIEEQTSAADDAGDMDQEDELIEKRRGFESFRRELKVACGAAKDFDEHWNAVGATSIYGAEQFLQIPAGTDERYVWTVTDADGELCISPGIHRVNFQHYYLTTEPWTEADLSTEWILT